jgi:hypothetical protein
LFFFSNFSLGGRLIFLFLSVYDFSPHRANQENKFHQLFPTSLISNIVKTGKNLSVAAPFHNCIIVF